AAVRLQRARVDADVVQPTVRVGDELEHQAAERLAGVSPAGLGRRLAFLVLLLHAHADDRRPVERAGQVVRHGVEQRLDADVLAAGAAQYWLDLASQGQLADDLAGRRRR